MLSPSLRKTVAEAQLRFELDLAYRMSDLIDEITGLQPQDIELLTGLAQGLWEPDDPERETFRANLQELVKSVA